MFHETRTPFYDPLAVASPYILREINNVGCRWRENIWLYLLAAIGSIESAREIFPLTIWHFRHVVKAPSGPSLAAFPLPFFPPPRRWSTFLRISRETRFTERLSFGQSCYCYVSFSTRTSPAGIEFLSVLFFFFYLFIYLQRSFFFCLFIFQSSLLRQIRILLK